jgi:uncharacterized repeat protein (TIGR03803 family)
MQSKARSFGLTAALPILTPLLLILGMPASAQQEKVLHFFSANGTDGYGPSAKLILDASGNVYGVTARGGLHNNGIVFELTNRVGRWRERILHTFGQMHGCDLSAADGIGRSEESGEVESFHGHLPAGNSATKSNKLQCSPQLCSKLPTVRVARLHGSDGEAALALELFWDGGDSIPRQSTRDKRSDVDLIERVRNFV